MARFVSSKQPSLRVILMKLGNWRGLNGLIHKLQFAVIGDDGGNDTMKKLVECKLRYIREHVGKIRPFIDYVIHRHFSPWWSKEVHRLISAKSNE